MVPSLIVFIYGLLIGSFINVVIIRLPNDEDIFVSRSKCMTCGNTLRYYDLVPVFSFLFNKGKCRYCGSKISFMYMTVELYTAISALFAYNFTPTYIDAILYFSLFCMITIVSFIDYKHGVMFDSIFVFFAAIVALLMFFNHSMSFKDHLLGLTVGAVFYALIYILARLYYKKEAFGQGDVILLGVIGLYLGWKAAIIIGFAAFYVAAIILIARIIKDKINKKDDNISMKSEMYFGPSVGIATLVFCVVNLIYHFI